MWTQRLPLHISVYYLFNYWQGVAKTVLGKNYWLVFKVYESKHLEYNYLWNQGLHFSYKTDHR